VTKVISPNHALTELISFLIARWLIDLAQKPFSPFQQITAHSFKLGRFL
jgi:hypothetical protein